MKKMACGLTLLILLTVVATSVPADDRQVTAHEDGYTQYQGDPLWYKNNIGHVREKITWNETVWGRGGYGCGYSSYVQPYYRYSYSAINYPTPKIVAPPFVPGWKEEALKIARQRDEYESYLKTLDALGFRGQYFSPSGSQTYNLPFYHPVTTYTPSMSYAPAVGSYGVQGNTTYGYSYNSLKELYGSTDLNALYMQAARLGQGAQQLAGDAVSGHRELVALAGTHAGRVAEVLARAQAAATALEAAKPQGSVSIQQSGTVIGSAPAVPPPQVGPAPAGPGQVSVGDPKTFLRTLGYPLCGACHGDRDPKGKFRIADYPGMPLEQRVAVWSRLLSDNPERRMPRTADGKPSQLNAEQLQAFLSLP